MSCCLETSFGTKASFFFHALLCFHPVYPIPCPPLTQNHKQTIVLWTREAAQVARLSGCKGANPDSDVLSSACAALAATNLLCWFMLALPERRSIRHWGVGVRGGLCRSLVSCLQKMQPSLTVPSVLWKPQRERAPLWMLFTGERPNLIVPQSL